VRRHDFGDGTIVVDRLKTDWFRERVEVAGRLIRASGSFEGVTNAISICISGTIASTDADGIQLPTIAVAIPIGNVGTPTVIDGTGTIADSAGVEIANTIVHIVTDAVRIGIRRA